MAIDQTALPYGAGDLEPYISKRAMQLHYGKHYASYVRKLNQLIEGTPYDKMDLTEIVRAVAAPDGHAGESAAEVGILHNAAQAWNHEFLWHCMSPKAAREDGRGKHGGYMQRLSALPDLARAVERDFGSLEIFFGRFERCAIEFFGSGWAWLYRDPRGKLAIGGFPNEENPLTQSLTETPLLACDLWEHAYYLDYQDQRASYVRSFFQVIDWAFVADRLGESIEWRPAQPRGLRSAG